MIAYKFLRRNGTSAFTGFRWTLPDGGPGPWVDRRPDPCRSGIHACRVSDMPFWAGPTLYEVELAGETVDGGSKLVASRARLLRRIELWDEGLRDVYTRMCADRAHQLAASVSPPLESWDAVVEPSIPEGPALLGFVAARIAEEISGPEAYHAERTDQARWLAERLDLEA
jgi:hypothetical protein